MSLLQKAKQASTGVAAVQTFSSNEGYFQQKWNMATAISQSAMIPEVYRGKIADVMMLMELSEQMRLSLFTVSQNVDIIKGKAGWKSSAVIAFTNSCGRFKDQLQFEWTGQVNTNTWGCRAWAVKHDGTKVFSSWVTIQMAKSEGWYDKKATKWKTMPEQMLQYRAASFFGRLHIPDILQGLQTVEEIIDVVPTTPETAKKANELPNVSVEEAASKIVIQKEVGTETPPPKQEQTQQEQTQKEEVINAQVEDDLSFSTIEELLELCDMLGFEMSGPTKNTKGAFWIQAIPSDESADVENLKKLGFKAHTNTFVMEVTMLMA